MIGIEEEMVPNLHESVSVSEDGKIQVTINNLSITDAYDVEGIFVESEAVKNVKATILTNDMDAHNTFDNPDKVVTKDFNDYKITKKGIDFRIPACSVLHLEIEI